MASASPITRDPLTKISAFAVKQNKQKPKKNARPEVNRQQQVTRASDTVMVSQLSDQCLPARGVLKMKKVRGVLKMKNRLALKRTSLLRRNTQGRPAKKSKWIVQERTSSITSVNDVVDGNQKQILPKSSDLLTFINSLDEIANSRERASKLFEWLIAPIDPDVFFSNLWEKKPLLLRRHNPDYYRGLFSMEEFDRILHEEDIQYGMNIDVTSFSEDKRETHNGSGRAYPSVLWDFFQNGCSLRMLNPQSYSATLWKLLSLLQEHFGSMAGANVYVTPAGTQGFAPHYDDIEAFVLQIEGKKFWRVYDQQSEDVRLPRFSSQNFSQEELNRQPILEEVLEPGDVLYFPRGFVHQAKCQPSTHSLHITISTFQRNTYGDLLEKLLPQTLQSAIEQDVELRRGLPRDLLHFMGVEHIEKVDPRRKSFQKNVRGLMDKIFDNVPLDAAVDQFAKGFLHDCLPPPLTKYEWLHSVHGLPTHWKDGKVHGILEPISGKQAVRLLRDLLQLCAEDDEVRLYHTIENARTYHGKELASITLNYEVVGNVEFLLNSYPEYVTVESMPEGSLEDKVNLAMDLFENGILIFGDLHTS